MKPLISFQSLIQCLGGCADRFQITAECGLLNNKIQTTFVDLNQHKCLRAGPHELVFT